ncbi:MAG TPA: hypothetical protein VFA88_07800 [Gaiellaceae bacterium]|nr:hypothetical protein [Gaiellaceae bacterium]
MAHELTDVGADYRQLLRRGSVMRRLAVAQHGCWRRAIRAQARTDELKVRTWSRPEQALVYAILPDWAPTADERERLARRLAWLQED